MTPRWKTVRVFLCSTFRNMHAEREHLIKVTFPALREKLLPFRVKLYNIDLHWSDAHCSAGRRKPLATTGPTAPSESVPLDLFWVSP
jgi:telomerase protein component 1